MDLKSSAENVTMHGFGRITGSKSLVIRSFWVTLMFGFSALCVFQLVKITSKYFGNSSVINDETVIASEIQFPGVTICGPAFSKWKFSEFAKEHNFSITPTDEYIERFGTDKHHYGMELLDTVVMSVDNLKLLAPNDDEFLLKNLQACRFDLHKCNYTNDYEKLLVFFRSYCYRFNQHGKFKQNRAGAMYGFQIILFLNISDVEPWSFIKNGDAAEIIIQNPAEYPFTDAGTIYAPAGHLSQIEIQKSEIKRMRAPYPSNCTNGEHVKLIYPGKYTTLNCMESCYAFASAKECNAVDFHSNAFLPNVSGRRPILSEKDVDCSFRVYDNLVKSKFSSCNCNLPCHETKFHKSVSYSLWPGTAELPFYKKIISKSLGLNASTLDDDYVRKNFLKISIFFGDMTYKVSTEERKYKLENLISDIGGQMGIWLGASMFSVIELLCLMGQFLCSIFESKGKEQNGANLENLGTKS